LREIREVAQAALDNVRGLSQTLHPSILEELGLESTIDWYLPTVKKQLGIDVTYEREGTAVPVDATIGIHVYRVLQEALSNVARHSGADRAVIRLHVQPSELTLEIEDHGRGFGPAGPRVRGSGEADSPPRGSGEASRGLGLVAMRERAELVNGSIELLTPSGGGTIVRLKVPLSAAAHTAAFRTSIA
jgi:signal transduction histidine kinase